MQLEGRIRVLLFVGVYVISIVIIGKFEQVFQRTSSIANTKSSNCSCSTGDGDIVYDFCYRLPQNSSVVGKKFSCSHLPNLIGLGLLNKSQALDTEMDLMPEPVFVVAFSENHAAEARTQILSLRKYFPNKRLYIYDLGLENRTRTEFKKVCNVELRMFDFKSYPTYVRYLKQYRWKPILIAAVLKEFGAIWYLDTSVTFTTSNLSPIENLVACRSHSAHGMVGCKKSGYLLNSRANHSIFSATSPGMFNYIPTNSTLIKTKQGPMYEAGFVFAVKTSEALETLKWYVLCALEYTCMAPKWHKRQCSFGENRFDIYAGCHRYDQSAINTILLNQYAYDRALYSTDTDSKKMDYYRIKRGRKSSDISSLFCE